MSGSTIRSRSLSHVAIPVSLIDDAMPGLKDTELRVLLVVLRQTAARVGADGSPRDRDWLSKSQLVARTGRGGDAVSSAVGGLERNSWIVVTDERGNALSSAASRRGALRLFFAAGPGVSGTTGFIGNRNGPVGQVPVRKSDTTVDTERYSSVRKPDSPPHCPPGPNREAAVAAIRARLSMIDRLPHRSRR